MCWVCQPPEWCSFCNDDDEDGKTESKAEPTTTTNQKRHAFVLPGWPDNESPYARGSLYVYAQQWLPVLIPKNAQITHTDTNRWTCKLCGLEEHDDDGDGLAFHHITRTDGVVMELCDACVWCHLAHGGFVRIELLSTFDTKDFRLLTRADDE